MFSNIPENVVGHFVFSPLFYTCVSTFMSSMFSLNTSSVDSQKAAPTLSKEFFPEKNDNQRTAPETAFTFLVFFFDCCVACTVVQEVGFLSIVVALVLFLYCPTRGSALA